VKEIPLRKTIAGPVPGGMPAGAGHPSGERPAGVAGTGVVSSGGQSPAQSPGPGA
jgi:hypothetical protein